MKKFVLAICVVGFAAVALASCFTQKNIDIATHDFKTFPFKNLSEYGFFKGELKNLEASERVLVYEPIAPLFTDYAHKSRFVWMPEGKSAIVPEDPNATFEFPNESILIKNFYYPSDMSKPDGERRIMETRLLVKTEDEWKAFPYVWNDEQTDAKYKVTGGLYDVHYMAENGESVDIKYAMPNKNQCKSCHNQNDKFQPIGPKVKQLNNTISYDADDTMNQLDKWTQVGYLTGYKTNNSYPTLYAMNDADATTSQRARSYLDTNCGHCHNLAGPASTSGLYLNYEENDPFHWGVLKSPVAAGIGAGNHKYAISPGSGDDSIIPFRMNSTNPGIMMPEIGRVSIHTEGVALVKEWIDAMEEVPL